MVAGRQGRVDQLKEAYEGYYSLLRAAGADASNYGSFGYVVRDDKERSAVALKMALQELVGPV